MSPHFRKVLVWENRLFFKKCGKKCGMNRLLEAERLEERFMRKKIASIAVLLLTLFSLSGCSEIGSKATSMSVIYGATAVLSLFLLLGYCAIMRKRDFWFLLLFSSVVIVNAGYFSLSISRTIEEALLANRIAYLGSVFLPMAMLMIIFNTTRLRYKKWLPMVLLVLSVAVFLVAASPGYLDIYYKAVSIVTVNGVTVLKKEYGPWHCLYLFYLILYFAAMIAVIVYAAVKKKLESQGHAVILAITVGGNIGVWLLEQLVNIDFEFLSVSYIISELFLLGLYMMIQENEKRLSVAVWQTMPQAATAEAREAEVQVQPASPSFEEQCQRFAASISDLTQTERTIYEFYIEGKSTKEIMSVLGIKENTLKYHNKNLYGKLGVSSRKQLMEIAKALRLAQNKETDTVEETQS